MLRNLAEDVKKLMISIFEEWKLEEWKDTIIVPIRKPNKEPFLIESY